MLIEQFDAFFEEWFVFDLKTRLSFQYHFFIGAKISFPGAFFWGVQTASSH